MNADHSWRYTTLGVLLSSMAFFIIVQMVRIQVSPQADELREKNLEVSGYYKILIPAIGQIYDREGNLLAGNTTAYEVGVDLAEGENTSDRKSVV